MRSEQPLRYWIELRGQRYPAREVRGFEEISAPYRFEVRFALEAGRAIDPEQAVEQPATLLLERARLERSIAGIATDVSVSAVVGGVPEVTIILEPPLALTRLRQDIRIFRDKTVPQIVVEVLGGHGIAPTLRLSGSYASLPYVVQFRESDFAFISRLLEDEGIHYFFTEAGTMVLGDSTGSYDAIAGETRLPFRAAGSMAEDEEAVTELGERSVLLPGTVTLRDFNPEHPSLDMDVEAKGPTPAGAEYYEYPGEYALPPEGSRKVALRAEAYACEASRLCGRSTCSRLLPGATFELTDAPAGLEEGAQVVSRVEHDWHYERGGFAVAIETRRGDVTYRPPRLTAAPTITNPLTGFVTGPPGEDIHTDQWGRVKVHFHWDRLQPLDDNCSHWIPMLQDNTGHSMSIPRVGWEVLVHFLEGDPDRPAVVGRMYNPMDPPHLVLPETKTRSSIKSLTSPRDQVRDDSGTNEILFEDQAGEEFIQIFSQKDQNVVVANDKRETVLLNALSAVKRDEQIKIGQNTDVVVDGDIRPLVKRDQRWSTGGNRDVSIGQPLTINVGGNRSLKVGGMHFRRIGLSDSAAAEIFNTELVGGVILETALKTVTTDASKACARLVGGAHVEISQSDKTENTGKARMETIGGVLFVKAGGDVGTRAEKSRATKVGAMLRTESVKDMTLAAHKEIQTMSATAELKGPKGITLKVGDSTIVLKDGAIAVEGKSTIKLTTTGAHNEGAAKATQI